MTQPLHKRPAHHLRASDLRAAAQLATQATHAITRISEGVHQSVWRTLGAPSGATAARTRGLTGLVYQSITGVTALIGRGVDSALTRLEPLLQRLENQSDASPERLAVVAAFNGVMGDRLAASHNPLALPMTFLFKAPSAKAPQGLDAFLARDNPIAHVTPKLLLVIHGLCMNDLQWTTEHQGQPVNHATALASALDCTPVYLRYNSGLHVSQNGRELARQLEHLVQRWPTALAQITVLAHSMGGLLIRSALYYAQQDGLNWPHRVKHLVFLGTPHHGAPLERAGNWVDVMLGSTPYSRPFAKLGQLRSAGVTDLRYGHLLDVDWHGHDRFHRKPDSRQAVPLPDGIACFTVAATAATQRGTLADRLLGDGLVPLPSALGQHKDPARCLHFAPDHQLILYRTYHLQLLSSPQVTRQLIQWLA